MGVLSEASRRAEDHQVAEKEFIIVEDVGRSSDETHHEISTPVRHSERRRHNPIVKILQHLIHENWIGPLVHGSCRYSQQCIGFFLI